MLIIRLLPRPGLHRVKTTHVTPKTPKESKHEFATLLASITHGPCGDSVRLMSVTNTVTMASWLIWMSLCFFRCQAVNLRN